MNHFIFTRALHVGTLASHFTGEDNEAQQGEEAFLSIHRPGAGLAQGERVVRSS